MQLKLFLLRWKWQVGFAVCPLRDKWAVDAELTEIAAVCEACGIVCGCCIASVRLGGDVCMCYKEREMERDRVNFCLWFMWAWRVCVCVWDVNRGEVHWASELVQSGFWHARAVHTNFIGSRWHDSPYGLAPTACSLWTYPQILLSVCPVMLHALTRINSAVWFP